MLRTDRIASIVALAFGAILMFGALRLDLGSANAPGPGFLPLASAGLLVALSLAYAVSSFRLTACLNDEDPWPERNRAKLIVVVASLALFCAMLSFAGFILSTFALMVALFLVAEPGRWPSAIIKAALSTAVAYLVFERLLMIQFPPGLLGT